MTPIKLDTERAKKKLAELTAASKAYRRHPTECNRLAMKKAQREFSEAAQMMKPEGVKGLA